MYPAPAAAGRERDDISLVKACRARRARPVLVFRKRVGVPYTYLYQSMMNE